MDLNGWAINFKKMTVFVFNIILYMFQFLIGIAIGWTAARSVPPPPPTLPAWSPPTLHDISLLTDKVARVCTDIKEKLDKE